MTNNTNEIDIQEFLRQAFDSKNFFINIDNIVNQFREHIDAGNIYLKNEATGFLNEKLNYYMRPGNFYANDREFISYIDTIVKLYRPLFESKKRTYDLVWKDNTLYLLDQTVQGRALLLEQGVDIRKPFGYKSTRKLAVKDLCSLIYKEEGFFFYPRTIHAYEEKIQEYQTRLSLYFDEKQHDWSEIIARYPSIQMAQLAVNFGHEIRPTDIKIIFSHVINQFNGYRFNQSIDNQYNIQVFSSLIVNAKFFEHTLAPSKKIEVALSKFFNYPLSVLEQDPSSYNQKDKFAMELMRYPEFKVHNFEKRIENRKSIKNFGTIVITQEQRQTLNQPNPVVKKRKI